MNTYYGNMYFDIISAPVFILFVLVLCYIIFYYGWKNIKRKGESTFKLSEKEKLVELMTKHYDIDYS